MMLLRTSLGCFVPQLVKWFNNGGLTDGIL
jgi:hypothetical protein